MGRRIPFFHCIIGVLVFASMVQAQDPRGTPGVDYPNFFTIPETTFKCSEQKYNPGFYADLETNCQAFHFCYQDRQESFLCPTGTIFHQAVLTCDVWHKSNCSLAPMFYNVNVGPVMERAGKNLPMLLRLRNRSQSKPVQTSTASVFEKVSSLYETNEAPSAETSNASGKESKAETNDKSLSPKDLDNKDEQISDIPKELDPEKNAGEENYRNELSNESDASEVDGDVNLVYDNLNDEYYRQYADEWREEPENEEYGNFYGYEDSDNVYGAHARLQMDDHAFEEGSFQDADLTVMDDSEYSEFRRRAAQPGYSRLRRKPVYVVLDDEPEDEEAAETGKEPEFSDILDKSEVREGKELNLTSEGPAEMETTSAEPFPRPTRIPPHQLELSTETPMTSEEFEEAIFSELVEPQLPDNYGVLLASTYPQHQNATQSEQNESPVSDTQSDDDTIYIEDDMESESSYVPYGQQYGETGIPEQNDEAYIDPYSSPYEPEEDSSDTEDTFLVIPDEYDDNIVDQSSEDLEMEQYPEETAYRRYMLANTPPEAGYGTYNYEYAPNINYAQQYEQSVNYNPGMYRNIMPSDQVYNYERGYEVPDQLSSNYESYGFDADGAYGNSELYQYAEAVPGVTESPELPVTEADLDAFSTEDFNELENSENPIDPGQEFGKSEDIYYVLDTDEESKEDNETNPNEETELKHESYLEKSENVDDQSHKNEQTNTSNDGSAANVSSNSENEKVDSTKVDISPTSNFLANSQNEQLKSDNMDSNFNPGNILPDSNYGYGRSTPFVHEGSASPQSPFTSNLGSYDFSTDPMFLSNMGYSESMDFGPYGFGPNMGQQFSMMDSMQQNQAASPFAHRTGQTEQPKVSPLSAIQEKMRTMKRGKFGAFKKYISSTTK